MQQAGLLALHNLKSLPVMKNSGEEFKNFQKLFKVLECAFYSYGDSAGITPASLLIQARLLSGIETNYGANVKAIFLEFKNRLRMVVTLS